MVFVCLASGWVRYHCFKLDQTNANFKKKHHSYLLKITKRQYVVHDFCETFHDKNGEDKANPTEHQDGASADSEGSLEDGENEDEANLAEGLDGASVVDMSSCMVVPVCREAVAMALDNSNEPAAKHFLTGLDLKIGSFLRPAMAYLKGEHTHLQERVPSQWPPWLKKLSLGIDENTRKEGRTLKRRRFLLGYRYRKERGVQITLDTDHSVDVGMLDSNKNVFGWTETKPLHVLYIVSQLSFRTFCLKRQPPKWVKAYAVNAGELTVNACTNRTI
eukprot:scaffold11325_cov56-Attheya_sp.AAC.9